MSDELRPKDVSVLGNMLLDEVERAVVGKRDVLELVLIAMLARGHVLLEDLPGLAKTLIARSFAQVIGVSFSRIQFTPDLMPGDVTGSSIFDQKRGELVFRPGPVFANLVLGDEVNRAPPKTQSALLEAMAEQQVTVEGETRRLSDPFLVVATQNPIEFEGTYPLPEAQLDRFLMRLSVGYPSRDDEHEMLERRIASRKPTVTVVERIGTGTFFAMQQAIEEIHVAQSVLSYVVDIVSATRDHPSVQIGASPRGSLALLQSARSRAALFGRDFVTPDDVDALAVACLSHRVELRAEHWIRGTRSESIIEECLQSIPTPLLDDASDLPSSVPFAP